MNKKDLFLSLSLLAIPGLVDAAGYDLATPEFSHMASELSRTYTNQQTYIDQSGSSNRANVQQDGRHLLSVVNQSGNSNQANVSQSGSYNLAIIDQDGSSNKANISQTGTGKTGVILQRGSGNRASIVQPSSTWTSSAVVVQNSSHMAVRVITR